MEFLVIIFIIISLLSSLSKQSKKSRRIEKKRKREILFDPWSFEEEFPEDRLERKDEGTVGVPVEEEEEDTFLVKRRARSRNGKGYVCGGCFPWKKERINCLSL